MHTFLYLWSYFQSFSCILCWQHNQRLLLNEDIFYDFQSVLYVHRLSDGSRIKQFPLDIGSIVGFSGQKKQTEVSC